jgi:hypothetical protein
MEPEGLTSYSRNLTVHPILKHHQWMFFLQGERKNSFWEVTYFMALSVSRQYNRSLKVAVQGPEWPTPYAFIHSSRQYRVEWYDKSERKEAVVA